MSCPDWHALRDRRDAGEEPAWDEALAHLDGCRHCRDDALDAEPTLLFHALPAPELDAGGIEAMKRAVAGMRRIEPIERRGDAGRRPRTRHAWLRAAALAGLLVGAASLQGPPPAAPAGDVAAADAVAAEPAAEPETLHADAVRALRQMPLVESADPFFEPIIQVDEEISLVVVSLPGGAGASSLGV